MTPLQPVLKQLLPEDAILTVYSQARVPAPVVWTRIGSASGLKRCVSKNRLARRGVRVAEGARLESVFPRKRDVGSNPTLSAS